MVIILKNILSVLKQKHYLKYDISGNRRNDPRRDIFGVYNIAFFLKPGYTKQDYYNTPIDERDYLIDWSKERWLEWCKHVDKDIQECIPLDKFI